LFVFAEPIAHALTALHPEAGAAAARQHAASYFRIVAICLGPQAIELVIDGAFGGAGLTVPPMVISTIFSLLRIPLAIVAAFPLGLGADGIWAAIALTALLRGVVAGLWFARGTWKTRTV
jgi:Na+-driven multidrug efflux pump